MKLNQTTLYVAHILEMSALLETIFGVRADYQDEQFAQLTVGDHMVMLSKASPETLSQVTLHCQVADVDREWERLAKTDLALAKPVETDWGTYSLMVKVSDTLSVDFYSLLP